MRIGCRAVSEHADVELPPVHELLYERILPEPLPQPFHLSAQAGKVGDDAVFGDPGRAVLVRRFHDQRVRKPRLVGRIAGVEPDARGGDPIGD
ncbi:MAG: hypothetical protein Q8O78_00230, partial [Candidatus Deferrimicrobium sp.]|nr:hypothetical protein [Candidatus Deferrimicrobium sp.]